MSDISIVTAFFDIGRGDWTPAKGLPHYLERSVETYIERFSHLAQLDNELIVISTEDIIERLKKLRVSKPGKTKYMIFDPKTKMSDVHEMITKIQKSENFQKMINPAQVKNPEYWNPDYVLVTNLKAYFVNRAIQQGLVTNDMVAWIDFGYCRDETKVPKSKKWEYDFDEDKIHLFNYKDYDGKAIVDIVCDNDVYILGAKVVAHKKNWPRMEELMWSSFNDLRTRNMVDDDQGLFLISYLTEPDLFELHRIPDHQKGHDPFVVFQKFNSTVEAPKEELLVFKTHE